MEITQEQLAEYELRAAMRARERCAAELERAFAECQTLNLLHGAARIRAFSVSG